MRNIQRRTGIALMVLVGLAGSASAQSAGDSLDVLRAKARFVQARRTGESRHQLKLKLRVGPRGLPGQHVPELHALRLTLDGVALCDAAPGTERYRVRKNGTWRYSGEIAGGRVTVSGDGRSGKVKLALRRAHVPDLRDSPAVELPLSVELANTEVETAVTFRVLEHRTRLWRGVILSFPPIPDPNPDPDPDPDPDPGPGDPPPTGAALRTAIIANMNARGVTFPPSLNRLPPGGGFDAQTLRCPSGALAEVVSLASSTPGGVDRFSDTAYFCRDSRKYWAFRAGGFAGFAIWVGPYTLP